MLVNYSLRKHQMLFTCCSPCRAPTHLTYPALVLSAFCNSTSETRSCWSFRRKFAIAFLILNRLVRDIFSTHFQRCSLTPPSQRIFNNVATPAQSFEQRTWTKTCLFSIARYCSTTKTTIRKCNLFIHSPPFHTPPTWMTFLVFCNRFWCTGKLSPSKSESTFLRFNSPKLVSVHC